MSTPYTGNPVGAGHGPDTGPAPGHFPTVVIPENADDDQGAWAQPFETLADHIAYIVSNMSSFAPALFGDGSDGAATVSLGSPLSLLGVVKNYSSLTVGSGGIITSRRSIIRVSGTLAIDPAGLITGSGANGANGTSAAWTYGNAPTASGGAGGQGSDGIGGSITPPCAIGGGTSGGDGGTAILDGTNGGIEGNGGPGTNGADFAAVTNAAGLPQNAEIAYLGRSGVGGDAGFGNGQGGGGCRNGTADDAISPDLLTAFIYTPGYVYRTRYANHGGTDLGSFAEKVPLRGGAGGAGGAIGTNGILTGNMVALRGAGGGGAGGDCVLIFARTIVLGSALCIQARGGNGGDGAFYTVGGLGNSSNAGGGGGGGRIAIFHGGMTGSLSASAVAGGTAGHGRYLTSSVSDGQPGSLTTMRVA